MIKILLLQQNTVNYVEQAQKLAFEYVPTIIKAVLVLVIGFWIIGRIVKLISKVIGKADIEISLVNFLSSVAGIALKLMLLFAVAGMLGIQTTSFVAIFGALMVGVGMAFNGSIGHFISGIMLMIFKPFKVGDLVIVAGGQRGTVTAINAFNTTLKTLDNKKIIIANSNVNNNIITNISGQQIAGVELTFGIGYDDDIDKARAVILKVGKACPYILNEPAQGVVVAELGDNSVNLATRPFCKSEHVLDTKFYMNENVKKEFDKEDIGIPYPQMDVKIKK